MQQLNRNRPARSELAEALAACRGAFYGTALISGMSNILMLTGAMFMLEIYDRVLPSRSIPTLVGLLVLAGGLFAALGVLDAIRGRILVRIGGELDETLSGRVYDTLMRAPLRVGARSEGTQPLRDLDALRSYLSGLGPVALFDLPWIPLYLAVCFAFHPLIGFTALAGAIILDCADIAHRDPDARADQGGNRGRCHPQWPCGSQPAQRRGADLHGDGGPHRGALVRSQPAIHAQPAGSERSWRRPWRDFQSPADDAAVRRSCGRRLPGDQPGSQRGHHHRGIDSQRARAGASRSWLSQTGKGSSPRGRAGTA